MKPNKYFVSEFKNMHSLEARQAESEKIMLKHPDRIPIIVEKTTNCKVLPQIKKFKYLVPSDLTVQQMLYIIRKYLKVQAETAIYIFCDGIIPPSSASLNSIYKDHRDEDGFLYIFYNGEDTFGGTPN